jgi:hypothetical protein
MHHNHWCARHGPEKKKKKMMMMMKCIICACKIKQSSITAPRIITGLREGREKNNNNNNNDFKMN